MQISVPGYTYHLENFEDNSKFQELNFIHKEPIPLEEKFTDGELRTVADGTTNEEVLRVLINRMQYLNNKFPCRENSIVLTHLETALLWLEKRTADRKARGVEGKQLP